MGGDRVGALRVWSPSPPGVRPHLLGSVLTSWEPPSLLGVCPHLFGAALTSSGPSSPPGVRPYRLSSPPGICPHLLGSVLMSWDLPSPAHTAWKRFWDYLRSTGAHE